MAIILVRQSVGSSKKNVFHHTPLRQCDARSLLRVVADDGINSGRRPELTHSTAFPERISLGRMETRHQLTSVPLAEPLSAVSMYPMTLQQSAFTTSYLPCADQTNSPKGIGAAQSMDSVVQVYLDLSPPRSLPYGVPSSPSPIGAHIISPNCLHSLRCKRHSSSTLFHLAYDKRLLLGSQVDQQHWVAPAFLGRRFIQTTLPCSCIHGSVASSRMTGQGR